MGYRAIGIVVVVLISWDFGMILITGASGRLARRTADFLERKGYTLRLMTRTPERAPKLEGAEVLRGDFADGSSMDAVFAGVTTALVVSRSAKPGKRAQLHQNAFEAAACTTRYLLVP